MNIFYINGCSFVAGAGLPECHRATDEVPSSLGGKLNSTYNFKEYHNDSQGGCSNDRIRRKTIDFLIKNKHRWNEIVVVIGWTQFTRFELVDEYEIMDENSPNKYIQVNSGMSHTRKDNESPRTFFSQMLNHSPARKLVRFGIGEDWRGKDIGINTEDTWAPFMVRHYNLDDRYDKYLDNILYLQSFLKINNIKYVMFDSLWSINESEMSNKFTSKYDCIDFDKWVWGDGRRSWTEYLHHIDPTNTQTRVALNDDHPNKHGVDVWFDFVNSKLKELYG